jgi:hypothetical protein
MYNLQNKFKQVLPEVAASGTWKWSVFSGENVSEISINGKKIQDYGSWGSPQYSEWIVDGQPEFDYWEGQGVNSVFVIMFRPARGFA